MTKLAFKIEIPVATSLTFLGRTATPLSVDGMLRATFDVPLSELFPEAQVLCPGQLGIDGISDNDGVIFAVTRKQLSDCSRADTTHVWSGELNWNDFVEVVGADDAKMIIMVSMRQWHMAPVQGEGVPGAKRIVVGRPYREAVTLMKHDKAA